MSWNHSNDEAGSFQDHRSDFREAFDRFREDQTPSRASTWTHRNMRMSTGPSINGDPQSFFGNDAWNSLTHFPPAQSRRDQTRYERSRNGTFGASDPERQDMSRISSQSSNTLFDVPDDIQNTFSRTAENSSLESDINHAFHNALDFPILDPNPAMDDFNRPYEGISLSSGFVGHTFPGSPQGSLSQGFQETQSQSSPGSEGSDARDDPLYSYSVSEDGQWHCPFNIPGFRDENEPCGHPPVNLKCNYDKQIDSHLRPYRCSQTGCEGKSFSSMACRLRHERERHGMHGHRSFPCPVQDCERHFNHFPRQWNQRDHMKRVHGWSADPQTNEQSSMEEELDQKPRKRKPSGQTLQGRKRSKSSASSPRSANRVMAESRDSFPQTSILRAQQELYLAKDQAVNNLNHYLRQVDSLVDNLQSEDLRRHTQGLRQIANMSEALRNGAPPEGLP